MNVTTRISRRSHRGTSASTVCSPATGALVARVSWADHRLVDLAVAEASDAFERAQSTPRATRSQWCHDVADLVAERSEELAAAICAEVGKPNADARAEVALAVDGLRTYGGVTDDEYDHGRLVMTAGKSVRIRRHPLGVWAVITPWNFPVNIPVEYLGPALFTGNAVVWKPSPLTPRTSALLMACIEDAGVPAGLVNLVLARDIPVSERLVTHERVRGVGFTGGSATGARVARIAGDKHLLLELGGNGPCIVLDDADLGVAVPAVLLSAFGNAGQTCGAAGRIFVHDAVADEFLTRLRELTEGITLGTPDDPRTSMGPLISESLCAQVEAHVCEAVELGGRVIAGGTRATGLPTDQYFQPTIIDDTPVDSALYQQETFGPVAPVVRFADDEWALRHANDSPFGLTAAVFTRSESRADWFANRLQRGTVVINDHSNFWNHDLPFGGWHGKDSGRGRLGGIEVLREFTQPKSIAMGASVES